LAAGTGRRPWTCGAWAVRRRKATLRAHFAAAVLGLLDFDAGFALRSYAGPMLHIHSPFLEDQHLTPIHRQVPGMAAVRVEDCSHWVHLDQPDAFHELLERFLASTASH